LIKKNTPLTLAKESAKLMWAKKTKDIVLLNISKLTAIADYFVIGTVESSVQMDAVIGSIKKTFKEKGLFQLSRQEMKDSSPNWQIIDYGSVVVHVMTKEAREFYSLENVWHKARKLSYKK